MYHYHCNQFLIDHKNLLSATILNMLRESLQQFSIIVSHDTLFWFAALSGSGMLVIQFALNFLGITDSEGAGHGIDFDAREVKWLSKQALTGFLMMFGWIGLCL